MKRCVLLPLWMAAVVGGIGFQGPDIALAEDTYTVEPGRGTTRGNAFAVNLSAPGTSRAEAFRIGALKIPSADRGSASLVVHYMGDCEFTLFFQEQQRIKLAMEDYDKVVVLKFDEEIAGWLDWSERDEELAAIIDSPTTGNVRKYLKFLADQGYYVDIWIIGHGAETSGWKLSSGTYGSSDWCKADDIAQFASESGYHKLPIRMVWSSLCYGANLNAAWRETGARVVSGSRYVNFYPTNFNKFAKNWNNGLDYGDALRESATHLGGVNTFLCYVCAPLDKLGDLPEWIPEDWLREYCFADWEPKCVFPKTVCGDSECAKGYFVGVGWLDEDEWQEGMSGEENLMHSSRKLLEGHDRMTKNTRPSWE